jgi:acylphosphatase
MAADAAVHVLVSGRVQGVGFRYFTREVAARCGLGGWVKNLDDGRVELVAEGDEDSLRALVAQVERGPGAGLVAGCSVTWQPATGQFTSFDITY